MFRRYPPLIIALAVFSSANTALAETSVFANDDNKQPYFSFSIDQDQLSGAPDRSSMNTALTSADRMFVRNGHFYRIGKDGQANTNDDTRVRLYGVNLSFATNFPSEQEAVQLAKRLRKLGFNAVRLHHMDTAPGNDTNPPRSLLTPAPYPAFNPTAIKRLSYFIRALGQEGLYVNLNLHVSYSFRASVDRVPAFENNAEKSTYGSAVHVYYPRMVSLQEDFARQLLRALNLRGYPGLAMVEINNESSLLAAWLRREWKASVPATYEPELQQQWQTWLKNRYGSTQKACDTWGDCIMIDGIIPLMTPTDTGDAAGALGQLQERIERTLKPFTEKLSGPADPGKTETSAYAKRRYDFMRFLADTDKAYLDRLSKLVKDETDTLVPVTGTQMGYGGVLNFDSHARMDYIDEHFYIDHPDYPGTAWDRNNWRMHDTPLNKTEFNRLLALSFHRDSKKPYVISEFNMPFPNRQSAVIQPLMAAVAAAQDWDGLFFFDYMDGDNWADTPSNFTLSGDWGKFALTGQSAMLFRQGQFPTLTQRTALPVPAATRVAIAAASDRGALASHLQLKHGVTPETAQSTQLAIDLTGTAKPASPASATASAATSALSLNAQNILFLRTPAAKGIFGVLPNGPVAIDDGITVEMRGKGRNYVAFMINALDKQPLATSTQMLVTVSGAVTGTQPGSIPQRPKLVTNYKGQSQWFTLEPDPTTSNKPSGARDVQGPVWIERTPLRLGLPLNQRRLMVYPLNSRGERLPALASNQVTTKDGIVTIDLQANEAQTSVWYEIVTNSP